MSRTISELLAALDAFLKEHRRCGDLEGGVDGRLVWMACDCGVIVAHPVQPLEPADGRPAGKE